MSKVQLASITPIVEECAEKLRPYCDLKVQELTEPSQEEILEFCSGAEIVVIGEQTVTRETYTELKKRGMKLMGCARGTPVNIEDWKGLKEEGIT